MEATPAPSRASWLLLGIPLVLLFGLIAIVISVAALGAGPPGCGASEAIPLSSKVPKELIPIYDEAAAEFKLGPKGPAMLAAINFNETSFGTNMNNTTGSGAEGWMMFMPETWATYGVDANGDGAKDPFDPEDAIFAAARYLHASGAPGDWSKAIFAYNHAGWYVEKVLKSEREFVAGGGAAEVTGCVTAAPTEAVARMISEADRLSALRPTTEYVWGGSHGLSPTPANGPFDCSSAVSHLLQIGGFKNPTMDTVALASWGKPGPGKWVTIYVKAYDDEVGPAHTFIEFRPGVTPASERDWGTSGFVEPGHGPGWIPQGTFQAYYLESFTQRHPRGL
jgi:hypothetical protein